jgi:hypothetical protein
MSSNNTYTAQDRTPYTYFIRWNDLNLNYYGRRTAKGCHPEEFFITYFTSSRYVDDIISEYGMPDLIKVHKIFSDIHSCKIQEERFLKRVNAAKSLSWLNQTNGDKNFDTTGKVLVKTKDNIKFLICKNDERYINGEVIPINKYTKNKKWALKTPEEKLNIITKRINTIREKYIDGYKSKQISQKRLNTNKNRYGYEYTLQIPEVRESGKKTKLLKYNNENYNNIEQIKKTNKERYGYEVAFQNPEIRQKNLDTLNEKYNTNVINAFQITEIKEKSKQTHLNQYGVDHQSKRWCICKYCNEYKNIQHQATCPKNPNRKMPKSDGTNNGRAKIFEVINPNNDKIIIELVSNLKLFCKEQNLFYTHLRKGLIKNWSVREI